MLIRDQVRAALPGVVAVLLLAGAGPARGQRVDSVLNTAAESNRASARSQTKIDKLSDQTDRLLAEYRSTNEQLESLRVYNRQLAKLLGSQDEEIGSLQKQIDDVTIIEREIRPLMARMLDSLETFVELDLPFLLEERRDRVGRLRELLERADVTVAEQYRRLMEAYQIENDYARTIEAYKGTLEIDATSRTVDFLRIGRVTLVYQTLDQSEAGWWDQEGKRWLKLGSEFRTPIRQGLRMANKQAAFDLLRLPVPAPQTATPGEEGAE
jgi:tetratricopeptide (TPR) repeat protein